MLFNGSEPFLLYKPSQLDIFSEERLRSEATGLGIPGSKRLHNAPSLGISKYLLKRDLGPFVAVEKRELRYTLKGLKNRFKN